MNGAGKGTGSYQVIRCESGGCRTGLHELIGEEPLLIRIEGQPYSVVMRTPGEELFHAAGFCLGEGIVDAADDFLTLGYCRDLDPNVVDIRLKPERHARIQSVLERRGFLSQTSCGICGKEMIRDLHQILTPVENGFRIELQQLLKCVGTLTDQQRYYRLTGGSHAAVIFDRRLEMIAFAEDVGRHNALDKAIGKILMARQTSSAALLVLSSRLSYELVQKAARAHLPMVVSMSRPTAMAAEMGRTLNMTLACTGRNSELIVICGEDRILF